MTGCETSPPAINVEVETDDPITVPDRFRTIPKKPPVPELNDTAIAHHLDAMDDLVDRLVLQYRALIDWVEDTDH